jgi:hypothetical protein
MQNCLRFKGLLIPALLLLSACAHLPSGRPAVELVRDGESRAVIAVGTEAPVLVREAGDLLQRVIREGTGASLDVIETEPASTALTVLRLRVDSGELGLDKDGFVFRFPGSGYIEIVGGSSYGVMFGAQDFLERYAGVRWLMPGDLGEVIPTRTTLAVPAAPVREEPAFFSRQLSGSHFHGGRDTNPLAMFLFRQRMHGRMKFHHNLVHHPEFYPVVDGKRHVPQENSDYHWQPDLHADGIVEEGVRTICDFFDRNPGEESYSLGMNDTRAWDDSVMKAEDATLNSIGRIDLSDYFFGWANRIATGVLEKHPDKWFGCLAYNEVTDPPRNTPVHPRILPYVCIDRMYWADPKLRRTDMKRTKDWRKVADRLAWYDYIYGDQFYKVPRFYPHLMSRYLRFAHEHGVVAYYAEAYPTPRWTEGPKLYILLRLLWDPYLDVDDTLDEWCRLAVGDAAAPHLRQYYDFWETFWTEKVPRTDWFKTSAANTCYLHFGKVGYFEALDLDDADRLDAVMQQVAELAETPGQKERAAFLHQGWVAARTEMANYLEIRRLERNGIPGGMTLEHAFSSDFESERSNGLAAAGTRDDWKAAGMPKGWGNWQRSSSSATFGWDRENGRQSRGALALDATGSKGQPLCFIRTVTVEPHTLYRAVCDVRTEGVDEQAAVGITVKWQDKNGKWATEYATVERMLEAPAGGGWRHLEAFVRTPRADAPRLVFMLTVEGTDTGRVWFDNVELSRLVDAD